MPDLVQIPRHKGKWLHRTVLAQPQLFNGALIACIDRYLKPAKTLDRQNGAAPESLGGKNDRVAINGTSVFVFKPEFRPALRTRNRLGMKASVSRVFIFLAARPAHFKGRHGCRGPVIRNVPQNGQARSAMGAIGKGIAVTPVGRVADVGQACRACCGVRHHASGDIAFFTRQNSEISGIGRTRQIGHGNLVDTCQQWRVRLQTAQKKSSERSSPLASISTPAPSFRT